MKPTSGASSPDFAGGSHDHEHCIASALDKAERMSAGRGQTLTALRRQVLRIVWSGHRPLGAYEILDKLAEERGRVAPPTVYRALDFLLELRLIHRIESLNAFIGCPRPEARHAGQFFICEVCGRAAELADAEVQVAIEQGAGRLGFEVAHSTVEVRGRCPVCRDDTGSRDRGRRA